jgi:type IV secretory pathway TrbD component
MPGVLVVLLWLAAGGVATWLIGREEIRRVERRAESRSRDKVSP